MFYANTCVEINATNVEWYFVTWVIWRLTWTEGIGHRWQRPKKSQLSGRQNFARKNFPDEVRKIFWRHLEGCQTVQKLSRQSGNFPDCPETFQTVRKLSRQSENFPDSPKTFQTVRKLSRLFENFPDGPETFQAYTMFCLISGNFPDSPETFQTYIMFWLDF